MSDTETVTAEPRRSQRERKQAKPFHSVNGATNKKRKRTSKTDDEEDGEETERAARSGVESGPEDDDDEEADDADDDDDEGFKAPVKSRRKSIASAKAPRRSAPAAKKPRTARASVAGVTSSTAAPKRAGRPRKNKAADHSTSAGVAANAAQDSKISSDNHLFNAILNPAAALQSIVEDFLESLPQTPGPALADLINCILRACGCNESVDADTVVDYDGVVDALDNFTEGLKQEDSPIYPLTSKLPIFKKLRKSLNEFLQRLIASSAELGLLYSSELMTTLQTWVVAMSSSQLRSFRHTASAVALELATALCTVAAAVEKEAVTVGRQREGERKRKSGSGGSSARDKDLERKAADVRERKGKLAEYLKEFVDGVFVHRYRDFDPSIRAECVQAMGAWFSRYPTHFLDGAYLRYVGWVLSDANVSVRLAAVRTLASAYAQTDHISGMTHFTERFKPRLVEMARADAELSVRVAVCGVLAAVDGHGLLDEEQRAELCLLVFDEEPRIRRAVASFVKNVWEDAIAERSAGRAKDPNEQEKKRIGTKALAASLVEWSIALAETGTDDKDSDSASDSAGASSSQKERHSSAPDRATLLAGAGGIEQRGRIALAVEALWDEIDIVSDWEALLDVLLLDHSAKTTTGDNDDGERPATITKGRKGKKAAAQASSLQNGVDEAYRLEEVEEGVLLEVLVGALRKATADAAAAKQQDDEDSPVADMTRELIKALPALFAKHQTDASRIINVLVIPQMMNLDMYLQMRMISAYASLWDDVINQLTRQTSAVVLTTAVATISHMLRAISLQNTNLTKVQDLEDKLGESLRTAVANGASEDLSRAQLSGDEALAISAVCARISTLAGLRDMTAWTEEDEGGKQSPVWDIVLAIAERGRLGYRPEEKMVEHAIRFLTAHIMWKTRGLTRSDNLSPEERAHREKLRAQRDALVGKTREYAIGTQSNAIEGVKRAAFQSLMTIHVLFAPVQGVEGDIPLLPSAIMPVKLDDEAQFRCAEYIQTEIERYAEELEESTTAEGNQDSSELSDPSEDETQKTKKSKAKATDATPKNNVHRLSRNLLQQEYAFVSVISSFLQAICAGAINIRHGAILLAHYGRLGPAYDACTRALIEVLRDDGMYQGNGAVVADVIVRSIKEAFTLVLDKVVRTEDHAVALSKSLISCLMIRGAQLSIVRRLDSQHVMTVHTALTTWIAKHIGAYESNNNKGLRNTAVLFFRVLIPLLATVDSRDALRIKAHVDQVFAQAKIEPSATAKFWEPYRAYEKRLSTAVSKDKGSKSKKAGKKGGKTITDESETEADDTAEDMHPPVQKPPPRPRPRRRTSARQAARGGSDADEADASSEPEPLGDISDPALADLPPARRTTRYKRRSSLPASSPISSSPVATPEPELPVAEDEHSDSATTPKTSRKRMRDEGADVDEEPATMEEDGPVSPAGSQVSRFSEVVIKRKRVRR